MLGTLLDFPACVARLQTKLERIDGDCMKRLSESLDRRWDSGKQVFTFGNGGSGATASHFAEDLGKR